MLPSSADRQETCITVKRSATMTLLIPDFNKAQFLGFNTLYMKFALLKNNPIHKNTTDHYFMVTLQGIMMVT